MSIFFPSFYLLSSLPPLSLSVFKDFFILEVLALRVGGRQRERIFEQTSAECRTDNKVLSGSCDPLNSRPEPELRLGPQLTEPSRHPMGMDIF